jgi:membrane-bound lytic murein transglycosylase F
VWILLALSCLIFPFLASCAKKNALEKIRKTGQIIMITRNNGHCFYTYRDQPMGFEYDLAKAFSEYLGVELRVVTTHWEKLLPSIEKGEGDFVAASLTILPSREERVDFSEPYLAIQQKVILNQKNRSVRRLEDLVGKTVHVRKGTSYEERLKELRAEGYKIIIKTHNDTPTEELIERVANKEIDITIADSNIALLNRRYHPEVKIGIAVEKPQSIGWAVKKGEKELLEQINAFFRKIKADGTFNRLYDKYYGKVEVFDYLDLRKYHRRIGARLDTYKPMFKKAGEKYGFDWRLLAALAYQESNLDPGAVSVMGAEGLMQLTAVTAEEVGVTDRADPGQSVMGGTRYLRELYSRFKKARDPDRLLFALASYNAGRGHVLDAQKIAKRKKMDPNSWAAVEKTLPLLRHAKYFDAAKHGYCRGTQPVRFVERVMSYYDILKRDGIGG